MTAVSSNSYCDILYIMIMWLWFEIQALPIRSQNKHSVKKLFGAGKPILTFILNDRLFALSSPTHIFGESKTRWERGRGRKTKGKRKREKNFYSQLLKTMLEKPF